jgi:hypothetical protein
MNPAKQWHKIHAMSETELEAYAAAHKCELSGAFDDLNDLADAVCLELGIEEPADAADDAGGELDRRAREHQRKHPGLSYESCLGQMRKQYPELTKRAYPAKRVI